MCEQVFDWGRSTQDTILSSFFWGYIVLQIPAGWIAGRFGGKYLMLISMATTGVINLVLPIAAIKVSTFVNLCYKICKNISRN